MRRERAGKQCICKLCGDTLIVYGFPHTCPCGGRLQPQMPLPTDDQDWNGEWLLQTDADYPESFDEWE